MGHFNATCNLSNLPIFEGNKIVVIPLINVDDEASFNCCYPTDNFAPFAFPVFGEYNEYGGIIEPETIVKPVINAEYIFERREPK